ncbi:MAG: hypothetical protein ACRETL_13340 [Gammaproteobacteria bacterium]
MKTAIALFLLAISCPAFADPVNNMSEANSPYYDTFGIMTKTERYHKYDAGNQSYACSGPAYAAAHDSFYTDGKCWHIIYPTKKEWFEMYINKGK